METKSSSGKEKKDTDFLVFFCLFLSILCGLRFIELMFDLDDLGRDVSIISVSLGAIIYFALIVVFLIVILLATKENEKMKNLLKDK